MVVQKDAEHLNLNAFGQITQLEMYLKQQTMRRKEASTLNKQINVRMTMNSIEESKGGLKGTKTRSGNGFDQYINETKVQQMMR